MHELPCVLTYAQLPPFHEDEKLDSGVPEAEGVLSHVKSQKIISMDSANFENIEELDRQINQMIEKVDGSYKRKCIPCGKINRDISHAREHAETHIEGLSFPCQYCGKTFRSRHSLRVHKCSFIHYFSGRETLLELIVVEFAI